MTYYFDIPFSIIETYEKNHAFKSGSNTQSLPRTSGSQIIKENSD